MSKWDKDYIKLCKKILSDGVEVENRTGINTIKIPSYHLEFNLQEEFPCLTTKQLYFRFCRVHIAYWKNMMKMTEKPDMSYAEADMDTGLE